MPRMRRQPKRRFVQVEELTDVRLEFLLFGRSFLDEKPFDSMDDARAAWDYHRDTVLSRVALKPGSGTAFIAGTRPWAFWHWDQGGSRPRHEYVWLRDHDALFPGEHEAAVNLARKEWAMWISGWTPEAKQRASLVPAEELVEAWPHVYEVSRRIG